MHLLSTIRIDVPGSAVLRAPSFWERIVSGFGGEVHLETENRLLTRDVLSLVERVHGALSEVGVTNATCLAVDAEVLYFDRKNQDRDMPALVEAMRASAGKFTDGFETVTLVFEQTHGELELLVEARFSSQFRTGSPAAELKMGARVSSLRRAPSESQAEAKERVIKAHGDPSFLDRHMSAFTAFAAKLERAVSRAFGDATVASSGPKAVVLKPRGRDLEELAEISLRGVSRTPRHAPLLGPEGAWVVDPWDRYYKDLGYVWVDLELLDEMLVPGGSTRTDVPGRLDILAAGGGSLGDEEQVSSHARDLMQVHRAASHDFTEPDVRPDELRHYDEAEPSERGGASPTR